MFVFQDHLYLVDRNAVVKTLRMIEYKCIVRSYPQILTPQLVNGHLYLESSYDVVKLEINKAV